MRFVHQSPSLTVICSKFLFFDDLDDDRAGGLRHTGQPVRPGLEGTEILHGLRFSFFNWVEILLTGDDANRIASTKPYVTLRLDFDALLLGEVTDGLAFLQRK